MASTTPVYALPYPVPADTVDVPRDIQALANKLDGMTALQPPLVSSLPASPIDGQECYFQSAAMAAAGVVWHLRYRAAISDAFKWEFIGGAALWARVPAAENYANAAYGDLTTVGPDITLSLAGMYDVQWGARAQMLVVSAGAEGSVALFVAGTNGGIAASEIPTAQFGGGACTTQAIFNVAAAGSLLRLRYATQGGLQFSFGARWLRVVPVRVG